MPFPSRPLATAITTKDTKVTKEHQLNHARKRILMDKLLLAENTADRHENLYP